MGNQQMAYSSNHQPPPVEDSNEWYDSVTDVQEQKQRENNAENSVVVNGILDEFIDTLLESKLASSPSEALTSQYLPEDQQRNQTRPNTYGEVALNWKGVDTPPEPDRPGPPSPRKSCNPPCPSTHIPRKDKGLPIENEIKFLTNIRNTLQDTRNETLNKERKSGEENGLPYPQQQAASGAIGSMKELCLKSDSVSPLPCPEDCEILRESTLNENIKAFELSPKDVQTINQSGKLRKATCDPEEVSSFQLPSESIDKSVNDKVYEDVGQDSEDIDALSTSTIIRAGEEMLEKTASYLEYIARQELKEGSARDRSKVFTDASIAAELDTFLDKGHSTSQQSEEIWKTNRQKDHADALVDSNVVEQLKRDNSEEQNILSSHSINFARETPRKDLPSTDRTSDENKVPPIADIEHSQKKSSVEEIRNIITDREGKSSIVNSKKEDAICVAGIGSPNLPGGLDESPNCPVGNVVLTTPPDINNESVLLEESKQQQRYSINVDKSLVHPGEDLPSCNFEKISTDGLHESIQNNAVSEEGSQKNGNNLRELISSSEKQQTEETSPETIDPAGTNEEVCSTSKPAANLSNNENENESVTTSPSGTATNISPNKLEESSSTSICDFSLNQSLSQDCSAEPIVSITSSNASITNPNEIICYYNTLEGKQQVGYDSKQSVTICDQVEICEQSPSKTADDAINDEKEHSTSTPPTNNTVNRNVTILSSSSPTDITMVEGSHDSSVSESALSNSLNQNPDTESLAENLVATVRCDDVDNIPPTNQVSDCKTDDANVTSQTDFNHDTTVSKEIQEEMRKTDSSTPASVEMKDPITRQAFEEESTTDIPKISSKNSNEAETLPKDIDNGTMPADGKEFCSVGEGVVSHCQKEEVEANLIKMNDSSVKEPTNISSSCVEDFIPPSNKPEGQLTEKPSDLERGTENLDSKLCENTSTPVDNALCVVAATVKDETSSADDNESVITQTDIDNSIIPLDCTKSDKSLDKEVVNHCESEKKDRKPGEISSQRDINNTTTDDAIYFSLNHEALLTPNLHKQRQKNLSSSRKTTNAVSVKQKSFPPEAENRGEVKESDNKPAEDEFSDAFAHLPEMDKKPSHDSSATPQEDSIMLGTPAGKKGNIRPSVKEQIGYRQHKEPRRKSTATCSQIEKSENIPIPKVSAKATRSSIDAAMLPEATTPDNLYKEGNVCDLNQVISQFRHKQKTITTESAESHLKLEGKADLPCKFNTKKPTCDIRRNTAKNTGVLNFRHPAECNKEKKVPDAGDKNAENVPVNSDRPECKTSTESSQNDTGEQNLENLVPKGEVDFRGDAGEQKVDYVGCEERDVPTEKSAVATLPKVTETPNNSSPSMETKKERMPELKPETLKSLIADLSLNKSTVDVGCNTEEEWTRKDSSKKEAEWMKERKKLIGRIADLHQTQSATKFIVKELIFLVTSWMEGKDKQNIDLQETRQKLMNERDQALEDLRSVEESFYELHRRYEKIKKLIEDYKKNEEILKRQIADGEEKLQQQKQMFDRLVKHSEEKLEQANAEILNIGKSKESEVAVLTAQLRKAEMKSTSLEKALEQKVRENTELSSICEDLINKCGKK